MPLDILIAATIINRRIALPLLAAIWSFGHTGNDLDRDFASGFAYALVYAAFGMVARWAIVSGIQDTISERRETHPRPTDPA